jgi:hypothetical protein
MCNIHSKIKDKRFTGYKVSAKIGKEHFSPATGMKYAKGRIVPPEKQERLSEYFVGDILEPGSMAYNDEYVGMTAVFEDKADAARMARTWSVWCQQHLTGRSQCKLVVLEMTIAAAVGKPMWKGDYEGNDVIAGPVIKSFKEVRC